MKAAILAAGMATRLRPLTCSSPKCLLKIKGKYLLEHSIDALIEAGITEICIVTGYLGDMVEEFVTKHYSDRISCTFIRNANYERTNNIYSLYLCSKYAYKEELLLLDSDLLYDKEVIKRICRDPRNNLLCLTRHKLGTEEIKVVTDPTGRIVEINKTCSPDIAIGESLGIEKMSPGYSAALFDMLKSMIEDEHLDNVFYETAFERLIPLGHHFEILDISDLFSLELDTLADLENVTRGDYDRKKLHTYTLDLLKVFNKICREHNLHYSLWAGTLLGAVRHKGFIPWDDDIDVAMPREDYELFIKNADKWLPSQYEFLCKENDSTYPFIFGKIVNSLTTIVEQWHIFSTWGVYIDIFPLDELPSPSLMRFFHMVKFGFYHYCLYYFNRDPFIKGHGIHSLKTLLLRHITTGDKLYSRIKKAMMRFNGKGCDYLHDFDDIYKVILDKDTIEPFGEIEFEGCTFYAVHDADKYLKTKYGNYMTLPDISKRRGHDFLYVDFDRPYKVK